MTWRTVAGCLRLAVWLAALAPPAALGGEPGGYRAEYAGYTHGFLVLKLKGFVQLTPAGYDVRISFHTAGLAALVVSMDNESRATGRFIDGQVQPSLFEASGHLSGAARATRIVYYDGDPVVQALIPPADQERDPVPVADTRHTVDTLGAAALLIREVAKGTRCDGVARTFDGRRLAVQSVHTAGPEMLDRTTRSIFSGQALRCDIEGRQLAGFVRGDSEDLRRPRHGTAWLANMLPDAPPVPVRIAFGNRLLGQVTLYLTALAPAK